MIVQLVYLQGHWDFQGFFFWFTSNDMGDLISIGKSIEIPSMFLRVEYQSYLKLNSSIVSLFTKHVLSDSCVCQPQQDRFDSHEDSDQTQYYKMLLWLKLNILLIPISKL